MIKALKGCRFAGKDYSAGDIVPDSAIDSKALGVLAMMKIIQIVQEKVKPADKHKLPAKNCAEILQRYQKGDKQSKLAKEFNCCPQTISNIVNGK